MLAEVGLFCLVLAFSFSIFLSVIPVLGFAFKKNTYLALMNRLVYLQSAFCFMAFIALAILFMQDDFRVVYVASHSSLSLPWWFKCCALWGGHEGSMLLWVTLLCFWTTLVCFFSKNLDEDKRALVLSVLGMIASGFFAFILFTSNPFLQVFENVPVNGVDLNPLLQDIGFLFHPPMLYSGYVGFAIAFAFAISSLMAKSVTPEWARWTRLWTLAAWSALTLGITLGSWWAYRELGWGGWWFWDPVENASLMPWIVGTALIHSLIVSEKRQSFKSWTLLLAIFAFVLSLIGTFLVRSGVLTSVHAFAVSPERGLFMLLFLLVVITFSLLLYALRAQHLSKGKPYYSLSRESILLMNNVFLSVMMATVLLGTLYPLAIDALGLGKLSVGPPYFNQVVAPMMFPLLFLMGLAPFCFWQKMPADLLYERLKSVALLTAFFAAALLVLKGDKITLYAFLGLTLSIYLILATLMSLYSLRFTRKNRNKLASLAMLIAHLGVAISVLGMTLSNNFSEEHFVKMGPGDKLTIHGYQLTFINEQNLKGPNYHGAEVKLELSKGNHHYYLYPQKRIYDVADMVMTDSDIKVIGLSDYYVALGEPQNESAWSVRVYFKPFIRGIWLGGFMIFIGGALAIINLLSQQSIRLRKTLKFNKTAIV